MDETEKKPLMSPTIKVIASTVILMFLFTAAYLNFANYQPKALTEVREVKGYTTQKTDAFDLPTPRYAKGLGYDQTLNSKKFTFQTDKSPKEIYEFYSIILLEDDWKLKKEGKDENFYTAEFRKDDYSVTLWAAYEEDVKLTFASVEILELDD